MAQALVFIEFWARDAWSWPQHDRSHSRRGDPARCGISRTRSRRGPALVVHREALDGELLDDARRPLAKMHRALGVDLAVQPLPDRWPTRITQMTLIFEGERLPMRLEATIPDGRGGAVVRLADELGLSRSQLIDEALSLFLKAVLEVRRGRRLVTLDPSSSSPACEIATPTLAALEWTQNPQQLELPAKEFEKMMALSEAAPKPSQRLRAAAKRHAK